MHNHIRFHLDPAAHAHAFDDPSQHGAVFATPTSLDAVPDSLERDTEFRVGLSLCEEPHFREWVAEAEVLAKEGCCRLLEFELPQGMDMAQYLTIGTFIANRLADRYGLDFDGVVESDDEAGRFRFIALADVIAVDEQGNVGPLAAFESPDLLRREIEWIAAMVAEILRLSRGTDTPGAISAPNAPGHRLH